MFHQAYNKKVGCEEEKFFKEERKLGWVLEQRSGADVLSDGLITWLRQIRKGEPAREGEKEREAGLSCTARSLFFSCCQLEQAALHLHVDARPALLASVHLGTGPAVQPALNEGLCVDKGGWCVYSGAHTWQLGWINPGESNVCLSLSLSLKYVILYTLPK